MSTLLAKVQATINRARDKLAAGAPGDAASKDKAKRLLDYERREHGHLPSVKEEKDEKERAKEAGDGAPSDEYIEKLAQAADELHENWEGIEAEAKGPIAAAIAKLAKDRKPGEPEVSGAVTGTQSHKKDHPAGADAATESARTPLGAQGAIATNANKKPGGGAAQQKVAMGGEADPSVPSKCGACGKVGCKEPSHKKEKTAFSVTRSGHKLDAREYGAMASMHHESGKANRDYSDENPLGSYATGRHIHGPLHRLAARHYDYAAKKHEKGRNAWNPFGGLLTPSRQEKADEGKGKRKTASLTDLIRAKLAAGETPAVMHGGQPAPTPRGGGNAARKHLQSNEAAGNITPADTVVGPKQDMKRLLDEPMQSAAHDSVLRNNLRNAGPSGVKIAALQGTLRKLAERNPEGHKRVLGQAAKVAGEQAQEREDLGMKMIRDSFKDAAARPALH